MRPGLGAAVGAGRRRAAAVAVAPTPLPLAPHLGSAEPVCAPRCQWRPQVRRAAGPATAQSAGLPG
jgi:hypothetical protein